MVAQVTDWKAKAEATEAERAASENHLMLLKRDFKALERERDAAAKDVRDFATELAKLYASRDQWRSRALEAMELLDTFPHPSDVYAHKERLRSLDALRKAIEAAK